MICPVCQKNTLFYPRRLCCVGCGQTRIDNGLREIAFYNGAQARRAGLFIESPQKNSAAWISGYRQADIDFFGEKPEKVEKKKTSNQMEI